MEKMKGIIFALFLSMNILSATAEELAAVLNREFKNFSSLTSDFIQENKSMLIDDILISKGFLKIRMPDQLIWAIKEPLNQIIYINQEEISIKQGEALVKKIKMNELPMMKNLFLILVNLMQHKWEELDSDFKYVIVQKKPFKIEFQPRSKELKDFFEKIILTQAKDQPVIEQIDLFEANGDTIKMIFNNIKFDAIPGKLDFSEK